MAARVNLEWSKAYLCKPQDNIISHRYSKAKPFIPSYEKAHCPVNMNLLLGWEYARVWEREHDAYIEARKESEKTPTVKRQPYKRVQRKPNKTDRFVKRFQTSNTKVSGKSKPKGSSGGMTASAGKGRQAGGQDTLNCGYGDMVTANVQTIEADPVGEINTGDIDCEATTTKEDVKLMQNEITQKFPQSYIDPNQYLGGVPVDTSGVGDICQNIGG